MSFDITLPNINAPTEEGKNAQMRSYLYQLAEQLKYALNALDTEAANRMVQQAARSAASAKTPDEVLADFNAIKALVITSADIVEAYYEKISEKFSGLYVAKSSFPNGDEAAFIEQTQQEIVKNSTDITQNFTNVQSILGDIKGFGSETITVNACIKTGLLCELSKDEAEKYGMPIGTPLYGLEVGQIVEDGNGNEVFNKYARFTAGRLSFYGTSGDELGYFSGKKLHVGSVEISGAVIERAEIGELDLGGYHTDTSKGIAFKWKGGVS